MQQTTPKPQATAEPLKKLLKKQTAFSWKTWSPMRILVFLLFPLIAALLSPKNNMESGIIAEFLSVFQAACIAQVFLLIWTAIVRFIKPETTAGSGRLCFWLNILMLVAWPALVIKMWTMISNVFAFILLLAMELIFILDVTRTNRLILAIAHPEKKQSKEMASPCPTYFQLWNFFKSIVWLPLVIIAVFEVGAGIVLAATDHFTLQAMWHMLIVGSFFGAATLPFSLLALPCCFLTQTRTPYAFQRISRAWCVNMMESLPRVYLPKEEKPAFLWWLSHPGEPWPENFKKIATYIDVDSFNWQNPDAWAGPLDRAAQMYQKNLLKSTAPLPALVIGEQAQETAKEIADEPVTKITPLFQAVIRNDLPILQQLLPQHPLELNRPFLATGNTLLHVAALNGHEEIVRLLLEQSDIDKTRKNNDGKTAADLAREKGFTQIAELLQ